MAAGLAAWSVCAVRLPAVGAAYPQRQPSSVASTSPASRPAPAPSPKQLEQARAVFRDLTAQLTDADKARIEKLIAQLGSDGWKDREEAENALRDFASPALHLMRKAMESKDAEVAARARGIVETLEAKNRNLAMTLRRAIATRQSAKDTAVVGDLIALLDSDDLAARQTARWGLACLAGQDFGYVAGDEPDKRRQAARKAQEWWGKNKADFRFGADVYAALDLGGGVILELVLIPPGKFQMGSPKDEKDHFGSEIPQHEVTITKPFYMGVYVITQEQYEQVMGKNPSSFRGAQNPVETVSWDDAVEFCKMLSKKTGRTVHLPTEAQWEYTCRAGSKTRFSYGHDDDYRNVGDHSWNIENSEGQPHPVGQKKPNDWGLFDMHGNVWEWCSDWWEGTYANAKDKDPEGPAKGANHVIRGGCWRSPPSSCRSAVRSGCGPGDRFNNLGFRIFVDLE